MPVMMRSRESPAAGAMAVFGAERLKAANVACLACITKANVFGAPHVGRYERSNCAKRGRRKPISNRRELA